MLAFLPTVPGAPHGDFPREPSPRDNGTTGAVLVSLIAFCALLAPVGWAAWPKGSAAGTAAGRASDPTVIPATTSSSTTSSSTTASPALASATTAATVMSSHVDCMAKPIPAAPDDPCASPHPR